MAAIEYRVLTEIIRSGSLVEPMKVGLSSDHFKDPEARLIYEHLYDHWHNVQTTRTLPSMAIIRRRWPSFEPTGRSSEEGNDIKPMLYELKMRSYDSDARALAGYFSELVEAESSTTPENVIEVVKSMKNSLDDLVYRYRGGSQMTLSGVADMARKHYKMAKTGAIFGIPWPWQPMTEDTMGKKAGEFTVFYGRMKSMKCVCQGQRIMMSDGSYVPIEEVPEQTKVPSYTENTRRVRMAKAKRVVSGYKQCVEVTTESGLRLRTSNEHLYMVPGGGYSRICDLVPGDYVATARSLPDWDPRSGISQEDAHFIGLLTGDGNYTRNEVQFTTADSEILTSLRKHVRRHGAKVHVAGRPIEYRIVGQGKGHKNPVLELLRALGVHGEKSIHKRAPKKIFSSSRSSVAAFLSGLLDTDGHISDRFVSWSSASRGLLSDVQHLLMRFGVRGRIKEVTTNYNTIAYQLYVYSVEQARILDRVLRPHLCLDRKAQALQRLCNINIRKKRNVDAVPYTEDLYNEIIRAKGDRDWPKTGISKFDRSKLFTDKGRISRQFLNALATSFESQRLHDLANTEIVWEQIDSIEELGQLPCYDICIEDEQDPNFVVEGFIVHNTWILLYCAAVDYVLHNQRVLVWSREMNEEQIGLRLSSILAGVDYQLFKKGRLPEVLERKMFAALDEMATERVSSQELLKTTGTLSTRDIRVLAGRGTPKTIAELEGAIMEFQPTIVYLDSFYHLHSNRERESSQRWSRIATIAEEVKSLAQDHGIPIVATHQANRDGEKSPGGLMDVADSDVIAREADLIVRILKRRGKELHEDDYEEALKKNKQIERMRPRIKVRADQVGYAVPKKALLSPEDDVARVGAEIALIFGGNREGVLEAFTIHAVPGYNFKLINAHFSSEEIKNWTSEEDKAAAAQNKERQQRIGPVKASQTTNSFRVMASTNRPTQGGNRPGFRS